MKRTIQDQVCWGVLGVGDVCEVKSAPAMNLVGNSHLVAVMRRNEKMAEDYARRHGVPKWYGDAKSLINDPDVNAIYIATPPSAHKELTLLAAAAGQPVYVEKPMARTYAECEEMIAACDKAGVPLFVAYYRRTLPHFLKIKKLIEAGDIGDVRHVRIALNQQLQPDIVRSLDDNWRVDPAIAGGGYFCDLASHQLDLLDFLLGPFERANGFFANQAGLYSAEDIVAATWKFDSGVLGSGAWCFTTNAVSTKDETVIVGSQGQISFATFGDGVFRIQTDSRDEMFGFELPEHIQFYLIRDVVDELLGRGQCTSTGETGARTNRVMDTILDAGRE